RRATPARRARATTRGPSPPRSRPAPRRAPRGTARRGTTAPARAAPPARASGRSPSAAPRQPEHALGDDVAEDLRGAGLDRVAAAAELLVVPVVVVDDPVVAEDLPRELRQPLVLLRPVQLRDGPLGAGDAGLHQ